jgi:hypothetical protein
VSRDETPLIVDGAPRDHDVVCDVTTRASTTTNVLRPVARPRVLSHTMTSAGPGLARLTIRTDLGGASTGSATVSVAGGAPLPVPINATDVTVDVPAGIAPYRVDLNSATDAPWGTATPATGDVSVPPRAVTGITGTATTTPCCSLDLAWTAPAVVTGSAVDYQISVVQPVPSSHSGCGFGPGASCTLTWNPADVGEPFEVVVEVQAFVNGESSPVAVGGPFLVEPPGPPAPDVPADRAVPAVAGGATRPAGWATSAALLPAFLPTATRRRARPSNHHDHEAS